MATKTPAPSEPIRLLSDNYAYAVPVDAGRALVVDPSASEGVEVALRASGRILAGLLVTHHHHDHIGGIGGLLDARKGTPGGPELPVVASSYDVARCRVPHASQAAEDNQTLELMGQHFDVMHVPGHTQGAVCYLWHEGHALFTGDTLFLGGCGRLIEGDAEQLYSSLLRIRALPPTLRIYCGHEYTRKNLAFAHGLDVDNVALARRRAATEALYANGLPTVPATLAEECQTNIFLRCDDVDLAERLGTAPGLETFKHVRKLRDAY